MSCLVIESNINKSTQGTKDVYVKNIWEISIMKLHVHSRSYSYWSKNMHGFILSLLQNSLRGYACHCCCNQKFFRLNFSNTIGRIIISLYFSETYMSCVNQKSPWGFLRKISEGWDIQLRSGSFLCVYLTVFGMFLAAANALLGI